MRRFIWLYVIDARVGEFVQLVREKDLIRAQTLNSISFQVKEHNAEARNLKAEIITLTSYLSMRMLRFTAKPFMKDIPLDRF